MFFVWKMNSEEELNNFCDNFHKSELNLKFSYEKFKEKINVVES